MSSNDNSNNQLTGWNKTVHELRYKITLVLLASGLWFSFHVWWMMIK